MSNLRAEDELNMVFPIVIRKYTSHLLDEVALKTEITLQHRLRFTAYTIGDLHGGSPMSHSDFKKWQCPLSLLLHFHVDFKIAECRLLNLRKGPSVKALSLKMALSLKNFDFET